MNTFQQKCHDAIIVYATTIYLNDRSKHISARTAKHYTDSLEKYLPKECKNRFKFDCPEMIYDISDVLELQRLHDIIENNYEWKKYDRISHGSTFRSSLKCLIAMRNDQVFCQSKGFNTVVKDIIPQNNITTSAQSILDGKVYESHFIGYERNQKLRDQCLKYYKTCKCQICGFDFEKKYGEIGMNFIEVHHIEQLSLIRQAHVIDPTLDLIPLCSNCHSMIHRKTPPYTPEELKEMVK